jgi:hypothetical protein
LTWTCCEEHKLWKSSLYNLLLSLIISSILGRNILVSPNILMWTNQEGGQYSCQKVSFWRHRCRAKGVDLSTSEWDPSSCYKAVWQGTSHFELTRSAVLRPKHARQFTKQTHNSSFWRNTRVPSC